MPHLQNRAWLPKVCRQFRGMYDERLRRWVAMTELEGLGPAGVARAVEAQGGLDAAWEWLRRVRPEADDALFRASAILHAVEALHGHSLSWESPHYPPLLAEFRTAPPVLHVKGALGFGDQPCVAVVGTRRCTSDAAAVAFRLGQLLARSGAVVVSGLARGIDVAAMKGALVEGGRVVAVFAHGLDRVHPPSHVAVAQAILDRGGAWWTEFAPGVPAEPWRFAWRNRIAVGASKALVMVQSPGRGGAMISVRWALEEAREVLVWAPGSASRSWEGNRRLLAALPQAGVATPEEVLTRLALHPGEQQAYRSPVLPGRLDQAWQLVLMRDGADVETVASNLDISSTEARTRLLLLELWGYVRRTPGDWYVARITGIDR